MKHPLALLFWLACTFIAIACAPSNAAMTLPGCQSETDRKAPPKSMDAGATFALRIATDTCIEDRNHVYGDGTYATLDCRGDGGSFRVEVPRKEWLDMKRDGIGSTSPGPGK